MSKPPNKAIDKSKRSLGRLNNNFTKFTKFSGLRGNVYSPGRYAGNDIKIIVAACIGDSIKAVTFRNELANIERVFR